MDTSKSKLQITNGKTSKVKLGASTSSKGASTASPLAAKKDYKKKGSQPPDFGSTNFGMTGLTGES
jgi:hypothetical protein